MQVSENISMSRCSALPIFLNKTFKAAYEDNKDNCSKDLSINSYSYSKLSISSLAILAKSDNDAKEALINTLMNELLIHARSFYRSKKFLDFDEIKAKLFTALLKAIEIYEESKGDFLHLLRRMYFNALKFYAKEKALTHMRIKKYYGDKISDFDIVDYLQPNIIRGNLLRDYLHYKIDIDSYIEKKNDKEKLLLRLFQNGYTFKEISSYSDIPLSTVAYSIYNMVDELKLILNVPNRE